MLPHIAGFYDEHREFLGTERIHIVASMTPSSTIGRYVLSTRFTATVRLAYMDYPDTRELAAIYGAYTAAAFGPNAGVRLADERLRIPAGLSKVAATMVDVHQAVQARFSVDEHRHYIFTPRDLSAWVAGLMRYDLAQDSFLEVLAYEGMRIYRDRLVDADSAAKFDALLASTLRSQWGFNPDLRETLYSSLVAGARSKQAAATSARAGKAVADGADMEGAADMSLGAPLARVAVTDLATVLERGKLVYEREERDLNVHLFPEAVEHVACVDRCEVVP